MSDQHTEAASFLSRLEAFFHSMARKEGFGHAKGTWNHRRFGLLRYTAVFGQLGNLYVTLMGCGTDAYLKHGQVRLWWYVSDATEPFSFERIQKTHQRPMSERTERGILLIGKTVLREIRWLKKMPSVEAVMTSSFRRGIGPAAEKEAAEKDENNELPTDGAMAEVVDGDFS